MRKDLSPGCFLYFYSNDNVAFRLNTFLFFKSDCTLTRNRLMRNVSQNGCCDYKRKISIQSWGDLLPTGERLEKFLWPLLSCSFFIGRKNLYRCKRFFFSFENIPARKSFVAGKIRKKSMAAIESVVSLSRCYIELLKFLCRHTRNIPRYI